MHKYGERGGQREGMGRTKSVYRGNVGRGGHEPRDGAGDGGEIRR